PGTRAETFRQDRKDCYTQECSGRETDQSAKLLVRQLQRCTDPSPCKRKNISREDLPERVRHLGACASRSRGMIFAAKMRLDRHVHQLAMPAKQRSIGIAALWLVRDDRNHRGEFSDADLPNMQISHE